MDIRPIRDGYAVSPQLLPEDLPALAADGYVTLIDNRPDGEIPPPLQTEAMRAAAQAAGMQFVENPVHPGGLTQQVVAVQAKAIAEAKGKVIAYCASGNRSTLVWALTKAGHLPTDEIIAAGAAQGYNVEILRDMIDMLASRAD